MANPQRRCAFCGEPGMTDEHVISDWLKTVMPRPPNAEHIELSGTVTPEELAPPIIRRRQGHTTVRRVRVVCHACNNVWLSRLEEMAKLRLVPLINGDDCNLDQTDQNLIAFWIAKVAMMNEFTHPETVAVHQADRSFLRQNSIPPEHWRIHIAYYTGSRWNAAIYHHGGYVSEEPTQVAGTQLIPNTQATTFVIGRLLAHASSSIPSFELDLGIDEEAGVIRIWPPRGREVTWPPAVGVDDHGADEIAFALRTAIGSGGIVVFT